MSQINNVIGLEVRRRLMDIEDLKHLSAEAQQRSLSAEEMARLAELLSRSTKEELDQIVIEGDSSVEAAQARVDAKGESHTTLKERLDDEYEETHQKIDDNQQQVETKLAETENNINSRGLNVQLPFGTNLTPMKNDDITDNTDAYNAMLEYASLNELPLFLPKGTYLIDPLRTITIPSNSHLHFDQGATLKAINTNEQTYQIVRMHDVENISITGFATVIGDRNENQTPSGEWGMGFSIKGAKDVHIENPTAKDCWGDGFYIGRTNNKSFCENITIINPTADNNRRQGMSIISVKGLRILNPKMLNTNGTAPEAGIDIEPNEIDEILQDVVIENIYTENNAGAGVHLHLKQLDNSPNPISIKIDGLFSLRDFTSIRFNQARKTDGVIITNNIVSIESKVSGIISRNYHATGPKIIINKPFVKNCNTNNDERRRFAAGISVYKETGIDDNETIGNIDIIEPTVIDDRGVKLTERAILVDIPESKNVSIIDPVRLDAERSKIFSHAENTRISDKNEILTLNMNNTNYTVEDSNQILIYSTRGNTDTKRITIGSSVAIGRIFEVVVMNNQLLIITPPTNERILMPGISTGKSIRNGITGSHIKLKKTQAGIWLVLNKIGDWELHDPE